LQSVENQGVDALFEFIITCFLQNGSKPKSYRKTTEKDTEKPQTVENQALGQFLFGFSV
jgi:hypothetical protein